MQRIFIRVDPSNTNIDCNARRRNGPISANPCWTGQVFPPAPRGEPQQILKRHCRSAIVLSGRAQHLFSTFKVFQFTINWKISQTDRAIPIAPQIRL